MKLIELSIENFKGIKSLTIKPNGGNLTITGANGTGKTTVYDAFLWLFYGKDSTGRTDSGKGAFEIHPLNQDNQPIDGLETMVEAILEIDTSTSVKLKKSLKEKIVKKQRVGWTTECWIDDVPKKVGEYQTQINELLDEELFKLLTDLHYFNEKLHWQDRRKMLMKLADEFDPPCEFIDFIKFELKDRKEEDYRKMITEQKKRLVDERDEINPRIDEQQKNLDAYAGVDNEESLKKQRKDLQSEIDKLNLEHAKILKSGTKRGEQLDAINDLKSKQAARETALRNDTTGGRELYDRKNKLNEDLAKKESAIKEIRLFIGKLKQELERRESTDLKAANDRLNKTRQEYLEIKDADFESEKCPTCGQIWPAEKIEKLKNEHAGRCNLLRELGKQQKAERDRIQSDIDDYQTQIKSMKEKEEKAQIEFNETKVYVEEELKKTDDAISSRTVLKPEDDPVWKQITADIERLEENIEPPASYKLTENQKKTEEIQSQMRKINNILSSSDSRQKAAERIKELQEKERALGNQITELEGKLSLLGKYIQAKAMAVEESVNDKFQYIRFKLFNVLLNESIEPACEAVLNGTPYSSCSYGEKALMGADIIRVLSRENNADAPVFIDNSESLTFELPLKCQLFYLKADPDIDELEIQITIDGPSLPDVNKDNPTVTQQNEPEEGGLFE